MGQIGQMGQMKFIDPIIKGAASSGAPRRLTIPRTSPTMSNSQNPRRHDALGDAWRLLPVNLHSTQQTRRSNSMTTARAILLTMLKLFLATGYLKNLKTFVSGMAFAGG